MVRSAKNKPYSDDEEMTDVEIIGVNDDADDMDDKTAEFFSRMREAGDGATLNILRTLTNGKSPHENIEEIPVSRYEWPELINYLRKEYGGGEYRIQLREGGQIRKWATVVIANKINPPATAPENSQLTMQLLARMDAMQAKLLERNEPDEMQMLEKWAKIKEVFSQPSQPANNVDMFEMVTKVATLLDKFGIEIGQREAPSGFGAFAPAINRLIDAGFSQPFDNPSPRPGAQTAQPNQAKVTQQKTNPQEMMIKIELQKLAIAAGKNSDPGIYAHVICDQIPVEIIRAFFIDEIYQQKLAALNPALKNHPEWLELLSEHIKAVLGLPSVVSHEYQNNEDTLNENNGEDKKPPHDPA